MRDKPDGPQTGVTWVVVVDAGRAEIYSREKRFSELEPVQTLDEPDARTRERDLKTDAPGRAFNSHGTGRHAMEPDQSPKARLREAFAERIAAELEAGRIANQYRHLAIVATPDMLGALRGELSRATQQLVSREIAKKMTGLGPAAIAAELDAA